MNSIYINTPENIKKHIAPVKDILKTQVIGKGYIYTRTLGAYSALVLAPVEGLGAPQFPYHFTICHNLAKYAHRELYFAVLYFTVQ